ncbi:putative SGT1 like protein [Blattamonas nauphoetae]|uniref:SGT1 like protein n=1 Tax=Blattamonas nauphoetae TaxID=2049346 RepID=A0ABQ9XB42_9EUKA|nr:putative SGT1 like protein [Blattamonas nauphoetae]
MTTSSPAPKYEFFQSEETLTFNLYVKQLKAEECHVELSEGQFTFTFRPPNSDSQAITLYTYARIQTTPPRVSIKGTKAEIVFQKEDKFVWPGFERNPDQPLGVDGTFSQSIDQSTSSTAKLYPSSKGKKDWDALAQEVAKQEEEEKKNHSGEESLNDLLKGIFDKADPDTRRAMMKSFQESNGTVLSTNWNEVGAKKVDPQPPKGMEVKDYPR